MNNILIKSARHSLRLGLLCLLALSFGLPAARAGLTFELRMYRNNQEQTYQFYTPLSTNSTAPGAVGLVHYQLAAMADQRIHTIV